MDKKQVLIKGGKGGDGVVSFADTASLTGGPDGGTGGLGGPVLVEVTAGVRSLDHLSGVMEILGEDGESGGRNNKTGRAGTRRRVLVPLGTEVWRKEGSGEWEQLVGLAAGEETVIAARGGIGGRGNRSFATPTERAPRLAEGGTEGETGEVLLEFKRASDVALIGPPNAGKSELLRRVSAATPRVASYPFTTTEPEVGVAAWKGRAFTVVEIPALLGESLRHAERAQVVVYLLDGEQQDLVSEYVRLVEAVGLHAGRAGEKSATVVVNKVDLPEVQARFDDQQEGLHAVSGGDPLSLSALRGDGIEPLLDKVMRLLPPESWAKKGEAKKREARTKLPGKQVDSTVLVVKRGVEFEVTCPQAERIARVVDLNDWRVRMQFHKVLGKLGVLKALERQGVGPGATVRIGPVGMEWR